MHIDKYIQLYKDGKVTEALPHLIIIVDEFAELKAEQPKGSWRELSGILKSKSNGSHLSIDELNDAIANAGAEAGSRGIARK